MPQVLPIKENLSNLLELASDGNCSLLFEEINQHLASAKIDPWICIQSMIKSFEIMILYIAVHMYVTSAFSEKSYTPDMINLSH